MRDSCTQHNLEVLFMMAVMALKHCQSHSCNRSKAPHLDRGKALDAKALSERLVAVGGAVHFCERDGLVAALQLLGGRLPLGREFLQCARCRR